MADFKIDAASDDVSSSDGPNTKAILVETQASEDARLLCLLLDKLPAELRNKIYDLAFAPEDDLGGTVDLAAPSGPPSKALLLTCRQINAEACKLYKQAYQVFWTSSHFLVQPSEEDPSAGMDILHQYREEDLNHINSLTVTPYRFRRSTSSHPAIAFHLIDRRGDWRREDDGRRSSLFRLAIQEDKALRSIQLLRATQSTTQQPTMRRQIQFLLMSMCRPPWASRAWMARAPRS